MLSTPSPVRLTWSRPTPLRTSTTTVADLLASVMVWLTGATFTYSWPGLSELARALEAQRLPRRRPRRRVHVYAAQRPARPQHERVDGDILPRGVVAAVSPREYCRVVLDAHLVHGVRCLRSGRREHGPGCPGLRLAPPRPPSSVVGRRAGPVAGALRHTLGFWSVIACMAARCGRRDRIACSPATPVYKHIIAPAGNAYISGVNPGCLPVGAVRQTRPMFTRTEGGRLGY